MLGEAIFPRGPREGLRFAVCVVRLSRDAGWVICVLKEPAEPVQNVPPSQAGFSRGQLLQPELYF